MSFQTKLIEAFNIILPPKERPGRESNEAYSQTQYVWAKQSYSHFSDHIDIKGKVVLDAGCGLGGKTVFFAEKEPALITGVDIDPKRIEAAIAFAKKNDKDFIEFKVASISELPFPDDTFDLIFLNDVVEHISRELLFSALRECKRVLKTGGRICLEFPPWESFEASHLYDYISFPWCQLIFSDETLIEFVKNSPQKSTMGTLNSVEHYLELNRIRIHEFDALASEADLKIFYFRRRMIKNLCLLEKFPFISKYLVSRAVYILSK